MTNLWTRCGFCFDAIEIAYCDAIGIASCLTREMVPVDGIYGKITKMVTKKRVYDYDAEIEGY